MTKRSQTGAKPNTPIKAKTAPKVQPSAHATKKALAPAAPAIPTVTTAPAPAAVPARPGGKLGLIIDRFGTEAGVTIDELTGMTGWQAHTVRAALSRLRTRGFATRLERVGDRSAYRLMRRGAE